jgi:hypothetical protein
MMVAWTDSDADRFVGLAFGLTRWRLHKRSTEACGPQIGCYKSESKSTIKIRSKKRIVRPGGFRQHTRCVGSR